MASICSCTIRPQDQEVPVARLPLATHDSVPADQRALFDELVQALGAVPRYGPGSVMIHVPQAHHWATGLNTYLRQASSLPTKVQELAMLVTARALDCQHIWNAHAASARQVSAGGTVRGSYPSGVDRPRASVGMRDGE
jgi:alkylhydroperoxidase family enzyme